MNIIARQGFELADYDVTVQHISHCAKNTLPTVYNGKEKATRKFTHVSSEEILIMWKNMKGRKLSKQELWEDLFIYYIMICWNEKNKNKNKGIFPMVILLLRLGIF